jgi:hypothetical protein
MLRAISRTRVCAPHMHRQQPRAGGARATQKKGFKSQSFKVSEFPASVSLLSSLVRLSDFSVLRRCSG